MFTCSVFLKTSQQNSPVYMKKIFKFSLASFIILCTLVFCGPSSYFEKVDNDPIILDVPIHELSHYVDQKENQLSNIKFDNEAQFIWSDSINKTEYSFVYLHGFSASHGEGRPIIQNLADRYSCNTYLSRLSQHGTTNEDAFLELTPMSLINSAKEAIAIGKNIGHKVILVSTSTGGTLSTYLAVNDPAVEGLIMMSPNFDLYDSNSKLLTKPWGKQMMRYLTGGNYRMWDNPSPKVQAYWTTKNRIEGYIALRELLDQTMTKENFKELSLPYFVAYYYKDENNLDDVISIDAIKEFDKTSSTPADNKTVLSFEDAFGHVIGCSCLNKNWESVQNEIFKFCDETLEIPVAKDSVLNEELNLLQ